MRDSGMCLPRKGQKGTEGVLSLRELDSELLSCHGDIMDGLNAPFTHVRIEGVDVVVC